MASSTPAAADEPAEPVADDRADIRSASLKVNFVARAERRFHASRERRARRKSLRPTVVPFAGYGGEGWVRVLARVLIVAPGRFSDDQALTSVRGFRAFTGIPVAFAPVTLILGGARHEVVADRGGVIDAVLPIALDAGWQSFEASVEGGPHTTGRVFIVEPGVRFGIVCDIDDTVMVTAMPRPLLAAWNSFIVHTHARQPVPGMAVLLNRLLHDHPGAPVVYLSTGAWNIAPTLTSFLARHLFPKGSMLLTDWGPTHDRWFRSGADHKRRNLQRLAEEFPHIRWLLLGDDGQHDDAIYTEFTTSHPSSVAAVAIRQLTPVQAMLAGGRTVVDHDSAAEVPWVTAPDGAGIAARLRDVGVIEA